MKFLETTSCTISTLSPVHIGCGEDYYPTNYVIDDGLLHHFSEEGLIKALTSTEKSKLLEIADKQGDSGILELQQFIHRKKDTLQNYATHSVALSKELEKFYLSRIGNIIQREANGKTVNNKLQIARHAFNPYNQTPYFAGSSIKGAIRTALLNAINEGNKLTFRTDSNDKLQKALLSYKSITGDPLRLLKVSDAAYSNVNDLHSTEVRFAVNRKNKPSKFEAKGPNQLLECLPANRSRSLRFDLSFLGKENGEYRWSLGNICKACHEFFVPQLEKELEMLQQLNYCNSVWAQGLEKLLTNEFTDAFREHKAFLLRIGQHGGAESNTLDGVRHIKIMQGKGSNQSKFLDKPTTIWLTANHKDQQQDLLPFGWVVVEIGDFKFEKMHDFLTTHAQNDYDLLPKLQALTKKREQFFINEKQKHENKIRDEQKALENERLKIEAETKKAEQLATMTAERQIIFTLEEYFKINPNHKANGILHEKLTKAIKQAENWSTTDKEALYEIGQILCNVWGKPKKLKDQLKTLQD